MVLVCCSCAQTAMAPRIPATSQSSTPTYAVDDDGWIVPKDPAFGSGENTAPAGKVSSSVRYKYTPPAQPRSRLLLLGRLVLLSPSKLWTNAKAQGIPIFSGLDRVVGNHPH